MKSKLLAAFSIAALLLPLTACGGEEPAASPSPGVESPAMSPAMSPSGAPSMSPSGAPKSPAMSPSAAPKKP
jgi:hypothetical protein